MTFIADAMAGQGARRRRRSGTGFAVVAGLVLGALAGLAFVAFVLWPRWPGALDSSDAPILPITVGGVIFNLPREAIRVPMQRRSGEQERIDLAFAWPSLLPPASGPVPSEVKRPVIDEPIPFDRLFVSISRADDPFGLERMRTIYQRHVASEVAAGVEGLAAYTFADDSPYRGEDLFVDRNAFARFAARCTRPRRGEMPGICVWHRQIAGAAILVRFPRKWLADWQQLIDRVGRLMTSFAPRALSGEVESLGR